MTAYAEPTWGTSSAQFVRPVTVFRQTMPSPILISVLLIERLQQHFAVAGRIWTPALKGRIWLPGTPVRNIYIGSGFSESTERGLATPAIRVSLAELVSADMGISSSLIGVTIGAEVMGDPLAVTKLWTGKHTIKCASTNSAEAATLATEVHAYLTLSQRSIELEANLRTSDVGKIPLQPAELPGGGKQYIEGSVFEWSTIVSFSMQPEGVW